MPHAPRSWHRYEELRPDELAEIVQTTPIIFWPLGLLEHHGWHLPVGLDGLKAERICIRIARRTGGVLLPTMWWGARGGHGDFLWTHYQCEEASEAILARTVEQLITYGFRALVLLAGHYPWTALLGHRLPALSQAHPNVLLLWGTEMEIAEGIRLPGDHAAREETSYGLELFPDLVDLDALHPGRDDSAWPQGKAPPVAKQHPGVCFDAGSARFAQMGQDARTASAERGAAAIDQLVERVAATILAHLEEQPS
jgi:creatinine amidohydrolase